MFSGRDDLLIIIPTDKNDRAESKLVLSVGW